MHDITVRSILSAQNGMNLYRGCTHGCIYCDARSTCYRMDHGFEDIAVKINAPQLLEEALFHRRRKCMIATGAMSDPYLHAEKELCLTRRCLELIDRYGFGLAIQTKSDLILRDLDLLKSINEKSKCVVEMTVTTFDEALCRVIEPNVCGTARRFEVLRAMRDSGIPTVVWMTPVLPFINDTKENIVSIVRACADAGVYGIITFGIGLTLRDGDREYFYAQLDRHFPGLKDRYICTYGNAYELPVPNAGELTRVFTDECEAHGVEWRADRIFEYMKEYPEKECGTQLSLFD